MDYTSPVERRAEAILSEFAITEPPDPATATQVRWQLALTDDEAPRLR